MIAIKRTGILGLFLLGLLLLGCNNLSDTPVPTLFPTEYIPTVIAMTLEAQGIDLEPVEKTEVVPTPTPSPTHTEQPTQTVLPSPTQATPASRAGPTVTVIPAELVPTPAGDIPGSINQIIEPGAGSRVISPFILQVAIKPGDNSAVVVELLGQQGQLLMREVLSYADFEADWLTLGREITFGINSASEAGLLQVSIMDEYGRLKSVSSVDLVLQSAGDQDLKEPMDAFEDIILVSPRPNLLIQGGTLRVSGTARPRSNPAFRIEIVTSDGKIVGTRQVSVNPANDSQYGAFTIDVPYNISSTNRARVQVWEPGIQIPGIINLSSVEVLLSP